MPEFTRQILRYARLPTRAARLALKGPRPALLALRMAFWVAGLSLLVRLLPLPRVLEVVEPRRRGAPARNSTATQESLARLLDSLLAANFWVFTPKCWKRAAVLHRFLALGGVETRVVFGVRREGDDALSGHAWLEADGEPLLETSPPDYVVTYSFP